MSTQFSLMMLPPQSCEPSHCRDTREGYLPWGASVPFTMRCSPTTFSNRWGTTIWSLSDFTSKYYIFSHQEQPWQELRCRSCESCLQIRNERICLDCERHSLSVILWFTVLLRVWSLYGLSGFMVIVCLNSAISFHIFISHHIKLIGL